MAGAVDLSFSSSASLEVFELDFRSDSPELPVAASGPERRALQSPLLGTAPPFLRRVHARPRLRRARGRQHRRLEPPRAHPPFLLSLNLVIGFVYDQHQGVQCPLKFLLRH